jgi:hypothetical protein
VVDSLGKRFREAKVIFIGKAVDEEPTDTSVVQNSSNYKFSQTLEVIKGFKGTKKKLINVSFDEEGLRKAGMCPTLYHFKEDQTYLVFAYGSNYEVRSVCSDTWAIPSDKESPRYEVTQVYLKKLDSLWFRFRAKFHLA